MAGDPLQYDRLMLEAARGVIRQALVIVADRGLIGEHHFYITFRTDHPEATVPPSLRARFPNEMTIVLQHQFWGLEVGAFDFSVTLSFDGKTERLIVPFAAIGSFVDPSVQFGLQFPDMQASQASGAAAEAPTAALAKPADESPPTPTPAPVDAGDRVVALDSFRKK